MSAGLHDYIAAVCVTLLFVAWYLIGRSDGRRAEHKRAHPYRSLAGPIFRELNDAERVVVVVERDPDDPETYQARQRTIAEDEQDECGCRRCNRDARWMVVCDDCGNKRCPRATSHDLACTGSNEPGQEGSVYA